MGLWTLIVAMLVATACMCQRGSDCEAMAEEQVDFSKDEDSPSKRRHLACSDGLLHVMILQLDTQPQRAATVEMPAPSMRTTDCGQWFEELGIRWSEDVAGLALADLREEFPQLNPEDLVTLRSY
ncbi:unnamed protein product [Polarella glacialis]|uniref:Uncharacterized protein n=1 Tax=Polarella glacialis TaxID=89957 RepID=A0A813HCU8_POLGL|nr:unnamed protein product [Polarella glacialis]